MTSLRHTDDSAALAWLKGLDERERQKAGGPGYASGGSSGAPNFTDAYGQRRAPNPWEMINSYKGIAYACGRINSQAVAKQPLRLYVSTGSGQDRPKCLTVDRKRDLLAADRIKYIKRCKGYADFTKAGDAEVEEVAWHPILAALADPNRDFTLHEMLSYMVMSMDLFGAAYVYPDTDSGPIRPGIFWPLYGHMVRPTYGSASMSPDYFQYFDREFTHEQLVRARHISPKDPYGWGYSPAQAAFEYLTTEDEDISTSRAAKGQAVRPSIFLTNSDTDNPVGQVEGDRAADRLNRMGSGPNAGRAVYLDKGLTPIPWAPDVKGVTDRELSISACKMVARCWGVPWAKLETEDVNKANAEAAHRQHSEDAIEPLCVAIANGWSRWLRAAGRGRTTPTGKGLGWDRLFVAFDNPVTEDALETAKVFDMRLKTGDITINEVRAQRGEDPVDWGDEPWLPGTLKQPSQIEEDRAAAAEQAEHQMAQDVANSEAEQAAAEADATPKGKMADPFPSGECGRLLKAYQAGEVSWDAIEKSPCRDALGRFAPCNHGGSGKKPKGKRKPKRGQHGPAAKKPAQAKPKPAAAPKPPKAKPDPSIPSRHAQQAYKDHVHVYAHSVHGSTTHQHIAEHSAKLAALPKREVDRIAGAMGLSKGRTKGDTIAKLHEQVTERKTNHAMTHGVIGGSGVKPGHDIAVIKRAHSAPLPTDAPKAPKVAKVKPEGARPAKDMAAKPKREPKPTPPASTAAHEAHRSTEVAYRKVAAGKSSVAEIDAHAAGLAKLPAADVHAVAGLFGLHAGRSRKASVQAIRDKLTDMHKSRLMNKF